MYHKLNATQCQNFDFNLRKISYERRDYESEEEKSFIIDFKIYYERRDYESADERALILGLKISYEHRNYESVDEKSLS